MSLSRGIGLLGESLITPRLSETRSQIYFLSLKLVGSSSLVRTWTKPPSFFVVGEFPCLVCLSCLFSCFSLPFISDDDRWLICILVLQLPSVLI